MDEGDYCYTIKERGRSPWVLYGLGHAKVRKTGDIEDFCVVDGRIVLGRNEE